MKLVLVRHGQTDQNKNHYVQGRSDWPLNETGIKDAQEAALVLKKHFESFDHYYSSPLKRASKTGEIIREKMGDQSKPIILDPHFYERDFGPYDGMKVKDVFPDIKPIPGYETDEKLIKRVNEGIELIKQKHQNELVLVTCHSHTIKGFLVKNFPDQFNFRSRLSNCAIFIIDYSKDKPILIAELNN